MAENVPWGVHSIRDVFAGPELQAGLPDGRWVVAVYEPYCGSLRERARAAWWIITGRAHALVWPKAGDLEQALAPSRSAEIIKAELE